MDSEIPALGVANPEANDMARVEYVRGQSCNNECKSVPSHSINIFIVSRTTSFLFFRVHIALFLRLKAHYANMNRPDGVNLGFEADSAARQYFVMEHLYGLGVRYVVGLSKIREKDSA